MKESKSPARIPFRWVINWKVCAFAALFLPVMVVLGFWQLARATEKVTLAQLIASEQARPAIDFTQYKREAELEQFSYRAVTVDGLFDNEHYWLIENKTWQGQIGYEVLMPLRTSKGEVLLVNRGWVKGTGDRSRLPEIQTPTTFVTLQGRMVNPSHNRLLAGQQLHTDIWPKLILQVNIAALEQDLNRSLWPQVLRLVPESAATFVAVNWQPINMPASKHRGYAVQWFSMAVALLLLTLFANSNIWQWITQKK